MLPHWVTLPLDMPMRAMRALMIRTLDPDDEPWKKRLQALDFTLEGFAVSAARLKTVADAIGDGRIGVEVRSTGPNFGAAYTEGSIRHFTLARYTFEPTEPWRAQIIHESIHAAFDLAGDKPRNDLNEACAYLGETAWWRTEWGKRTVSGQPESVAIIDAANEAVERLKLHKTGKQALKEAQVKALLDAINRHPGYASSAPKP